VKSPFRLTKWYLDCVSDAGDAVMVYCARCAWHGVRIHYSSVLSMVDGQACVRSSLRPFRQPSEEAGVIRLDLPHMKINGEWQPLDPAVRKVLLQTKSGTVDWNCVQPRARVSLSLGDAPLQGIGYAECLTLTMPPWQLPLRRLRWGRYASRLHSLTWIDWQGERQIRCALRDGAECAPARISDRVVHVDDQTFLELDRGAVLRDGELGRTVLHAAPGLRKLFPLWMRGIRETKWRSRAVLSCGGEWDSGWAIHETVEWRT